MLTRDGHRLHVTTYGPDDAPLTVLSAHCWTLNQHDRHYQVRDLQREFGHGIRIVTWDHRGHGESDAVRRSQATIDHLAHDWSDLVDALAPTGPLVLAGHSIGGMTLMALADARPELFERVVGAALAVEGLINSPGDTVVGFYEDCMHHERTHALGVLDGIPTHVLVGTHDVVTPPSHARRIASHVRGAALTVVPDAGHMLPLERDALVSGVLIGLVRPHLQAA